MKLTIDEIKERVEAIEGKQGEYRKAARAWEDMWNMKVFDLSLIHISEPTRPY